jgi:hypothetical protein
LWRNCPKKRRIADDRTFTFGYDHNNQLTHVEERLTDGGTVVQSVDFKYDVFQDRIEKSAGSSIQRFSYDGWDIWADSAGLKQLPARHQAGRRIAHGILPRKVGRQVGAGVGLWVGWDAR